MEYIIVDLQGFKDNDNNFVLKEICLWRRESFYHFIVKPPFDWDHLSEKSKKEANWLKNNYHGLDWKDGNTTFTELIEKIGYLFEKKNIILFVKGEEKVLWIKQLFKKFDLNCIINLEHMDCDINLNKKFFENSLFEHCDQHNHNYKCAMQNTNLLAAWFKIKMFG